MTDKKLTINLTSDKYNFVVEGRSIDKPKVFIPFLAGFVCDYATKGNYCLKGFDSLGSYSLVNEKEIICYETLGIKTIKIQVPDDFITDINIVSKEGNIFLKDIVLDKVDLSSVSGKIKVDNCSVDKLNISNFESKVKISDVLGNCCYVRTNNGNIYIANNVPDFTRLVSYNGNVYASLMEEDYKNTSITMKTRKNTIVQTVNDEKIPAKRLIMETSHGNVYNKSF